MDVPVPPEARVTLVGLREAVTEVEETVVVSPIVPVKLLTLVRVMAADVPGLPTITVRLEGAERVKSVTTTIMTAEWVSEPLVPATVTV